MDKIAAVVVTYNRKELLVKSLEGILRQSKKVAHIFIVDNASNDRTSDLIRETYSNNQSITYVKLPENTGSAGGFNHGVKMAHDWGADWVWFLDDDVAPEKDCLETMMKYSHISKCIHPSKKDINGQEFIWESVFNPATGTATFLDNISFKNGKDFTFVNMGCFEGMLVHRDIIDKIGYPDPRFFIAGDDVIYGFLASLYTNVIYLRDAHITKLIPFSKKVSPLFLYYAIRNQFLIKENIKSKNLYKGIVFKGYFALFCTYLAILYTFKNKSFKPAFFILKGIIHGLQKRFYKMP